MICTAQRKLVSSHIKGDIFHCFCLKTFLFLKLRKMCFLFFFPALFHSSICNRLMGFTFSDNLYQGRLASKVSFE